VKENDQKVDRLKYAKNGEAKLKAQSEGSRTENIVSALHRPRSIK